MSFLKKLFRKKQKNDEFLVHNEKILYNPETGEPILKKDFEAYINAIEKFLNQGLQTKEALVISSAARKKLLNRMAEKNEENTKNLRNVLSPSKNKLDITKYEDFSPEEMSLFSHLDKATIERIHAKVNDVLKHNNYSTSKLSQVLFDAFGYLNMDWDLVANLIVNQRKIWYDIESEIINCKKNEKIYFIRHEMSDCCKLCAAIDGTIALWSNEPLEDEKIDDPYASVAIWKYKTRIGKSDTEKWIAMGVQHIGCRGFWSRWEPSDLKIEANKKVQNEENKRKELEEKVIKIKKGEVLYNKLKELNERIKQSAVNSQKVFKPAMSESSILLSYIKLSEGLVVFNKEQVETLYAYQLSKLGTLIEETKFQIEKKKYYSDTLRELNPENHFINASEKEYNKMWAIYYKEFHTAENNEKLKIINQKLNKEVMLIEPVTFDNIEKYFYNTTQAISDFAEQLFAWNAAWLNSHLINEASLLPIKRVWKEQDTSILQLICRAYTHSAIAAQHFFEILFLEENRIDTMDAMLLVNFLNYFMFTSNIKRGAIIKKNMTTNNLYFENVHISVLTDQRHLYMPTYNISNRRNIISNNALPQLKKYAEIIGKCPTIQELDKPYPEIWQAKEIWDCLDQTPYSSYYKHNFGGIRQAFKEGNIEPPLVTI